MFFLLITKIYTVLSKAMSVTFKNLKHSIVINLIEVIQSDDKMYLEFEYVENDLKKLKREYSIKNLRYLI